MKYMQMLRIKKIIHTDMTKLLNLLILSKEFYNTTMLKKKIKTTML